MTPIDHLLAFKDIRQLKALYFRTLVPETAKCECRSTTEPERTT